MIRAEPRYAELATATNFSFLRGASHPEELVAEAARLGLAGLGIADRNSLAGVVRAHVFARENREAVGALRVVPGARLVFTDGTPDILAYPQDRAAYGRLCRLLTVGNLRGAQGPMPTDPRRPPRICAWPADRRDGGGGDPFLRACAERRPSSFARDFPRPLWLAASMTYGAAMRGDLARRVALSRAAKIPLLATNDVLMHAPGRRALADVVACIREGVKIDGAGRLLAANAERHLKDAAEMARLFREAPAGARGDRSLPRRPDVQPRRIEPFVSGGIAPGLRQSAGGARSLHMGGRAGALSLRRPRESRATRCARNSPSSRTLNYAPYFLTVHDIVRFARAQGILCQGRGSAANSAVCYCLGITAVDPPQHDLLFERFISRRAQRTARHRRRFRARAARGGDPVYLRALRPRARRRSPPPSSPIAPRSAIREVGKVFGLSDDIIAALTDTVWGRLGEASRTRTRAARRPRSRRIRSSPWRSSFANELIGFPRHLSQHIGGFVITRGRLDEVVPIENAAMEERTVIEWDKDDLDALGILKIDVLALGMLTAACARAST